jgi:Putative Ig domain/FG-GAP-like repeat/Domain of unknown function (DUF4114)/FG-GAP repeat
MPSETVNFTSANNFAVGKNPFSVTVGDFNRDGIADLATANYDDNNVSVLLGNGQGGFSTAANFAVGTNPFSIINADFNRDGIADLATSNYQSGNISILLGNGQGGFGTATNFTIGTKAIDLVAGDFNKDGIVDIAAVNDSSNLSILLGTGNGSFGTPTDFGFGTNPISVTVGDFNKDGISDLAAANGGSNNNVSIFLGTGNGSFGAPTSVAVGNAPAFAAVGDFNGDGIADLATPNYQAGSISVFLGTGNGSFGTATNFATGNAPYSLTVGDFNKDGIADFATANNQSSDISVLLGNGNGSFGTPTNFGVGNNPGFGTLGDFNGDGIADLVSVNRGGNNVSVLLNSTVVTSVNNPPIVANPIANQSIKSGSALNFVLGVNTFTDPDAGDVLSYGATLANGNSLPTWLTFNPTTRTFAGTPAAGDVGNLGIVVTATDKAGLKVASNFGLNITSNADSSPNTPPSNNPPLVLEVVQLTGIGNKAQGKPEGRTIDLSDYNGKALKADIVTKGDAVYTNNVGFYVVEDSIGSIKLSDGSILKPGDANYAAEAIKSALINSLQAGKVDRKNDLSITGGRIYAPVVVAQGTLTDFITKNPTNGGGANNIHAYFNYVGANSDKTDHFSILADNTFGVEDMYGGGDRDFNDLVVSMNVRSI